MTVQRVGAVVASAGATNTGRSTTSTASPRCAPARGLWLHVDAAYGGAALCVPEVAGRFAGIERADSVVVDPHKWLFAPLDCAALLYRDPATPPRVHTARRRPTSRPSGTTTSTRRTSHSTSPGGHVGLPFWFALVVHGTTAFTTAVRAGASSGARSGGR